LHVIADLPQGGAESVLYRLILSSPTDIEHVVVSMMGASYFGPKLSAAGVKVHTLENPRGRLTIRGVLKLRQLIVDTRPDVVQTWMYHADLIGGLVARWVGIQSVVWGIRASGLDSEQSSFSARVSARACALLSRWIPAAIVCCSERAAVAHQAMGYCEEKFTVIPNGYDLSQFTPDTETRQRLRKEWYIQPDQILLGMVARWDPQKDHNNLLRALALLKAHGAIFRCALVGAGVNWDNTILVRNVRRQELTDQIILAGPRDDIPSVMNALDLHILSSAYGEAFPNVVAEAMACGTPCLVTDVGDAALIVGTSGWIVPPQDAPALAQEIQAALAVLVAEGRRLLGQNSRMRIEENFSLEKMVETYHGLWRTVVAKIRKGR